MAPADHPQTRGRTSMRLALDGGHASVGTGLSVLDHLLELLARYAGFDLTLEVEPGEPGEQVTAAARALGDALAAPLRAEGARGFGWAVPGGRRGAGRRPGGAASGGGGAGLRAGFGPGGRAARDRRAGPLRAAVGGLEGRPTAERVGGLGHDLAGRFLTELAEAA